MEKIFAKRLLNHLKIIKGTISVHFATGVNDYLNDMLIVDIENGSTVFHYTLDDFQSAICRGMTSDMLAKDICKQYKRYILNKHFYQKSETIH